MLVSLIGYRGTGKSTVAAMIADALDCPWFDADVEVERQARKTIKQIFDDHGEPAFRDYESLVIAALAKNTDAVLALGGGAVMREANRRQIAASTVVWLTAEPETILERINADEKSAGQRPNLTASGGLVEITELLARREPVYRDCADFIVETDSKSPQQVAAEIVTLLSHSEGRH